MRNSGGFVKLYRSFLDWEWYEDGPTKILFLHLLLKANYQDKKQQGVLVKRGQYMTSIQALSEETGLSVRQTRTALSRLEATNEVTQQVSPQGRIITVKNYNHFQEMTNKMTNYRQTIDKPSDKRSTNLHINKENKEYRRREETRAHARTREELKNRFGARNAELYLKKAETRGYEGEEALRRAEMWLLEDVARGKIRTGESHTGSLDLDAYERWMWQAAAQETEGEEEDKNEQTGQ